MLRLLIKTRLRYYRNYIRYHFDRATLVEIAIIFFIFLLLLGRSPADIGFNLNWLLREDFSAKWLALWLTLLPLFYVITELLAHRTFRVSQEQQILGILPFPFRALARYYLFRLFSKVALLILLGSLPFWAGRNMDMGLKAGQFFTALGLLILLVLYSFTQACAWRMWRQSKIMTFGRWFVLELIIIALLVNGNHFLAPLFKGALAYRIPGSILVWMLAALLFQYILASFILNDATSRRPRRLKGRIDFSSHLMTGAISAFIGHDILFILRQKRATVLFPVGGILIMTIISLVEAQVNAIFTYLIIMEIIASFFLIKPVMLLFEDDVDSIELLKSFPSSAGQKYNARWLFVFLVYAIQLIIPLIIILIRFGLDGKILLLISITLIILPAILATLFCNTGFGLFPYTRLFEIIFTISLLFMFLFWFFMPFGTVIILFLILFWIRKSRRNYKFSEIV